MTKMPKKEVIELLKTITDCEYNLDRPSNIIIQELVNVIKLFAEEIDYLLGKIGELEK